MNAGHVDEFVSAARSPDDNLALCALLMARVAYPDLDPDPCLDALDRMGATARDHVEIGLGGAPSRRRHLRVVTEFVYGQLGFVGNEEQYDDPRNSLLNDVLARRTGIPITLALVFIAVARQAGLRVDGINFPGHFLVRCDAGQVDEADREPLVIDPFHAGSVLSEADCARLLKRHLGDEAVLDPALLRSARKREILLRMLLNLKRAYVRLRSFAQAHAVADLIVAYEPGAINELRDRGLLASQLKRYAPALRDLETWLRFSPQNGEGVAEERSMVFDHVKDLRRRLASLN
jgi:regulator of sirC expression with transglutaminase-like and TPR domain